MREIQQKAHYAERLRPYDIDAADCRCLFFAAGETLIRQGEPVESLYFIVEGRVEALVLQGDGRRLALCYTAESGALGDVELMQESDGATATVAAQTDVICLAYPYARARRQRDENLVFLRQVARDLSLKLTRSTDRLVSASLSPAREQVCRHLLQHRRGSRYCGTLTDIAAATGVSYRHIHRIIQKLCADGVVEKAPQGFYRLDVERLAKFCP